MSLPPTLTFPAPPPAASLSALEIGVIDFFVSTVRVLGLPKSIGEIYGLLFVAPEALPLDTLCHRLHMSKGSTSQGLKVLRAFGAVKVVYQPGDRRDHFTAEAELQRLVTGFIREQIHPRLSHVGERLQHLAALAESLPENAAGVFQRERLQKLGRWNERGQELLPLLGGLME